MEGHAELRKMISSLPQLQHCHQNLKICNNHLGRSLLQQAANTSLILPFSTFICWTEILSINPAESSSSHHPDEQGRKKRLEKSAAGLKGLVNFFFKACRSEIILFESSHFRDLFHSPTLLTTLIKNPLFCCS